MEPAQAEVRAVVLGPDREAVVVQARDLVTAAEAAEDLAQEMAMVPATVMEEELRHHLRLVLPRH